jgi:hypothetical protein
MPLLHSRYRTPRVSAGCGRPPPVRDPGLSPAWPSSFGASTQRSVLNVQPADRFRLVAVSAITVVALPWLVGQSRDDQATRPPAVATVGVANDLTAGLALAAPDAAAPAPERAAPQDQGEATTPSSVVVIDIAVPAPKPDDYAVARAGFRRWPPGSVPVLNPCATPLAPAGQTLTVTNLDNGHSIRCVNIGHLGIPKGTDVVIQTEFFEQLGDPVQAPVPVSLQW